MIWVRVMKKYFQRVASTTKPRPHGNTTSKNTRKKKFIAVARPLRQECFLSVMPKPSLPRSIPSMQNPVTWHVHISSPFSSRTQSHPHSSPCQPYLQDTQSWFSRSGTETAVRLVGYIYTTFGFCKIETVLFESCHVPAFVVYNAGSAFWYSLSSRWSHEPCPFPQVLLKGVCVRRKKWHKKGIKACCIRWLYESMYSNCVSFQFLLLSLLSRCPYVPRFDDSSKRPTLQSSSPYPGPTR